MPDQVDAELQHLRARAYGPGGDIDDASAERLRELEAQHLTARAARAPGPARADAQPLRAAASGARFCPRGRH